MWTLVGGLWITVFCTLGAAIVEKISWLQYLYYLSYIKVGTTPIKYTPQVGDITKMERFYQNTCTA